MERVFKATDRTGAEMEFELVSPGVAEENEGERQFRIAFSRCLQEAIFPKEKLREIMREHGMWTEDDEEALKKVVARIAILQVELRNAESSGNQELCVEIAQKIGEARARMWELFLIQQSVYMNSAEGVAEMIKTESIMAACTRIKATGQRYWKDYTEYVQERDENKVSTVYATVVSVQSKLLDSVRDDLMGDFPEKRYLEHVQEQMLDREIQEEVAKELRSRVNKKKKVTTTKKKTTRRKKKSVATKTNTSG